jgi:hypothetical protein
MDTNHSIKMHPLRQNKDYKNEQGNMKKKEEI